MFYWFCFSGERWLILMELKGIELWEKKSFSIIFQISLIIFWFFKNKLPNLHFSSCWTSHLFFLLYFKKWIPVEFKWFWVMGKSWKLDLISLFLFLCVFVFCIREMPLISQALHVKLITHAYIQCCYFFREHTQLFYIFCYYNWSHRVYWIKSFSLPSNLFIRILEFGEKECYCS